MGRGARRNSGPALPKVERVEISDKNVKLRIAAAVIFLIIGAAAIAYGFAQTFAVEKGWQEITAEVEGVSCSDEFTLVYDIGTSGNSARAERRSLMNLWSTATADAAKIFDPETQYGDLGNLASLNLHPNETVELEPALYEALELIESYGDRRRSLTP